MKSERDHYREMNDKLLDEMTRLRAETTMALMDNEHHCVEMITELTEKLRKVSELGLMGTVYGWEIQHALGETIVLREVSNPFQEEGDR